jgi:hypothetical protein
MLMRSLFELLRLPKVSDNFFNKDQLLSVLPSWRKIAVENGYYSNTGKTLNWSKRGNFWILDKAFKIDDVVQVSPNVLYGFDFTCNESEVEKKRQEIQELLPYIKQIGISKVAVVLAIQDNSGLGVYSSEKSEEIEESLWQILEDLESLPDNQVGFFTLDLKH